MHLNVTEEMSSFLQERHPTAEHVPGSAGDGTLIRRHQLLASARDAAAVEERLGRLLERRVDDEEAGVVVLHLRPDVDVCEVAASLSRDSHRTLRAGPNHVLAAGPNWEPGPADEPAPADSIPAPHAVSGAASRQVRLAILDSGISPHPWFTAEGWYGACGPEVQEVPDADHNDRLDFVAGHGTFIAGVVAQHAPAASLVIGKIIERDGVTDELELLRGLARLRAHAHQHKAPVDLISLSLGCYTHDNRPSLLLEHAFNSFGHETVIVACAGNYDSDRPYWPAAIKRVVAVASLDAKGTDRAAFSNYGWWVDACTIGQDVVSSFFNFDGTVGSSPTLQDFTGYAKWSGTSFAAPRVAAAIAARAAANGIPAAAAAAELLDPTDHPSMPDLGVLVDA